MLAELGYQYGRYGTDKNIFDDTTFEALKALYAAFNYEAPSKDGLGFVASSFIVIPEPHTLVSQPRSTGAVNTAPIAHISTTDKQVRCKGLSGELSPEITVGMPLLLHTAQAEIRTSVKNIERTTTDDSATAADTTKNQKSAPQTDSSAHLIADPTTSLPETSNHITAEVVLSESSGKHPVVPAAALWTSNGQTMVTVQTGDTSHDIPVTVLYTAQGLNEVKANEGTLTVGDSVKIIAGDQQ